MRHAHCTSMPPPPNTCMYLDEMCNHYNTSINHKHNSKKINQTSDTDTTTPQEKIEIQESCMREREAKTHTDRPSEDRPVPLYFSRYFFDRYWRHWQWHIWHRWHHTWHWQTMKELRLVPREFFSLEARNISSSEKTIWGGYMLTPLFIIYF